MRILDPLSSTTKVARLALTPKMARAASCSGQVEMHAQDLGSARIFR